MTQVIKKSRIVFLAAIFLITVFLLLFIMPLKVYADPYDVGDTGPGGGIVFLALPSGLCKEALPYNDEFFCNWSTAVSTCEGATINLYDDWYLPDITELTQVYTNLHDEGLGNFSNIWYWSSTDSTFSTDFAYGLWFLNGISGPYNKGNEFYIVAVRDFMGDPKNEGGNVGVDESEQDVWLRNVDMTCYQVWINRDNNFEFVFWWEYADNNWVKIYDMAGNEVFSIDMPYGDAHFIADLPDGIYTVKTFNDDMSAPLQEFTIGKP